jgi:hypothetical protein
MSSKPLVLLAAVLWCGACTPVINKTPVSGMQTDVSRLVGDWQGDYNSAESGRRGLITFRLRAGADTAVGDVIMQSRNEADPSAPDAQMVPWDALRTTQQALSIHFVFVTADEVSGVLDAYRDPDCGCTLTTTFVGKLRGDTIEGTFHSEGSGMGHIPQNGRWRVKRFTP